MKPNSDYHFNQMTNNEPFKQGMGYMVSVPLEQWQAKKAINEALVTALLAVSHNSATDNTDPCWCAVDARVFGHAERCLQSRAALALAEKETP